MSETFNLDHASGAPLNKDAKKALREFLESPTYNTDSSYAPAVKLRRDLAELKSKTAKLIGVKAPNIFITNGSSDATNKLFSLLSSAESKTEAITTNIEHSSLLNELDKFSKRSILEVGQKELVDLKKLESLIKDRILLVSIQYVNNETGQTLPIKEISRLLKKIRSERTAVGNTLPIFFHTDASQAAITQDIQIPRLGVDAMSLNGSKFGALPGTGILYLSADLLRWLDQKGINVKTSKENPLTIISLYFALKHSVEKKNTESKRLLSLSKTFWAELQKELPEAKLTPKSLKIGKNHSAHILNIHIPGVSGEKLVILAGMNNILISTGAACSASKDIPSHVLQALGLTDQEIQSSIRVSFGSANRSEKEVKEAAKELAKLCQNSSVRLT